MFVDCVHQFFIQGTYQHGLGLGSLRFWLFFADLVPKSVLHTWIYNNNCRSTSPAAADEIPPCEGGDW